jgi:hypothetical protein
LASVGERAVNARQLDVLKWIVAGCPDGQQSGNTYKTTAIALQGRRLVKVSKKGGVWSAHATDAGRHYVANGAYPEDHWQAPPPRSPGSAASKNATPQSSAPAEADAHKPAHAGAVSPRRPVKVPKVRPVDELLDALLAGMSVEVEYADRHRYSTLVGSARRSVRVSTEKMLVYREPGYRGTGVVELVNKPEWMITTPEPIPVAATLTNAHPAVAALRGAKGVRLQYKQETRQRALRVLNAIAKAAEKRGWTVEAPNVRTPYWKAADLVVTADGHSFDLRVTEQMDRIPHEPTAKELRERGEYSWTTIPSHDKVASGRLTIEIVGRWEVSQSKFSDTKTISMEDRVVYIVREIGLRAAKAIEARAQRDREHAAQLERWHRVHEQAGTDLVEHHRAQVLIQRAGRWQGYTLVSDYLAALADHVGSLEGETRADAEEWLDWAKARHASDPALGGPVGMPADPKVTADALRPFMHGLGTSPPEPSTWY